MRNDLVRIVNTISCESKEKHPDIQDIDVLRIYDLLFTFCKQNNRKPKSASLENGVLFIEEKPVERVAPLPEKMYVSEKACHYEGLVLARQE